MPRKKSVLTSFIPHKRCIKSCGGFGLTPMSGDLRPGMDLLPDTVMACDNTRSAFNIYLTEDVEVVWFHGKDHLVASRAGDKEMLECVKEIRCLVVILQLLNGNPMAVRVLEARPFVRHNRVCCWHGRHPWHSLCVNAQDTPCCTHQHC